MDLEQIQMSLYWEVFSFYLKLYPIYEYSYLNEATNKNEILDQALTRPGRFDRSIDVNLPDISGRKEIFMVHLKPIKLDPSKTNDQYAKRLATLTPGFSGADIANLCNEAAILAARKNKKYVESIDFELSSERVLAGMEKKRIISLEERRIVAVHESGHAVASWFLEGGAPLLKVIFLYVIENFIICSLS